jgi:hypothetical protein
MTHKPLHFHRSTARPGGSDVHRPPLLLGERVEELGEHKRAAVKGAIYRPQSQMMQLPANPHECWRIASEITVRPDFGITVKHRQKSGAKF